MTSYDTEELLPVVFVATTVVIVVLVADDFIGAGFVDDSLIPILDALWWDSANRLLTT